MPVGPQGQKRPSGSNACSVVVCKIATGEIAEEFVNPGKQAGGLKGAAARAKSLSKERRSEIARKAAAARWGK